MFPYFSRRKTRKHAGCPHILWLLVLTGCGRYADFTLPAPESSGPRAPFTWEARSEPVISHDASSDVLNPSVVRFQGAYWNFYSEFDGQTHAWHTAAATSSDGFAWTKLGRVLSPEGSYIAANGSAVVMGDEILYWYEAGYPLRIGLARSRDGKNWSRQGDPVVPLGPRGSFDERAVADPYVIHTRNGFYMFYLGQDRARRQSLGIARSSEGVIWEKLRTNPILEPGGPGTFDENGLGEPAVWTSGGQWWMLYTGRDKKEQRRLGLARSSDGVRWERVPDFVVSGSNTWDNQVVCDPSVEQMPDGSIRVWFGGGDVARPDQGVHGQIGLGVLRTETK
jgi:sucrose-6-phosphate hydrolase SacC (GH32 family)